MYPRIQLQSLNRNMYTPDIYLIIGTISLILKRSFSKVGDQKALLYLYIIIIL